MWDFCRLPPQVDSPSNSRNFASLASFSNIRTDLSLLEILLPTHDSPHLSQIPINPTSSSVKISKLYKSKSNRQKRVSHPSRLLFAFRLSADHLVGIVHLDRERQVIICVDPGRNSVTKISLHFEIQNLNMTIDSRRARLVDQGMA